MRAHTPGPWRVGDAGATVFGPKSDKLVEIIASVRKKSNARLIAAAPALLETLETMLAAGLRDGQGESYDDMARAAIAQAKGEAT